MASAINYTKKTRLSKCDFLRCCGLREIGVVSRQLVLQEFLCVCIVFEGWVDVGLGKYGRRLHKLPPKLRTFCTPQKCLAMESLAACWNGKRYGFLVAKNVVSNSPHPRELA